MSYYVYIIITINFTFNTKITLILEEKFKYIEFVKFYNFIDCFHPKPYYHNFKVLYQSHKTVRMTVIIRIKINMFQRKHC